MAYWVCLYRMIGWEVWAVIWHVYIYFRNIKDIAAVEMGTSDQGFYTEITINMWMNYYYVFIVVFILNSSQQRWNNSDPYIM